MDKDEVYRIACKAVERLVEARGAKATFTLDAIWQYVDPDVELSRGERSPGPYKRLINDGYIEPTGARRNAETASRAGSPATEYRPGWRFKPQATTPSQATASTAALSSVEAVKAMQIAMAARGFIITAAELANFYLALLTSPLVILSGISGTGKSRLPRLFAELIGAEFSLVSVQPQWSDNADLFGYTPSINQDVFVQGKFTKNLLAARQSPDKPTIVLLDEMNLAAVEHYFSDFLSIVETRRRQANGSVTTDPLPLDLPLPKKPDDYAELRELTLPPNVRIVGTANMDETTRVFSPKVLDRAFTIEFDEVDLTIFLDPDAKATQIGEVKFSLLARRLVEQENPISVEEIYSSHRALFDCLGVLLEDIRLILRPAGIRFGYRARNEICLYMWHWAKNNLADVLSARAALDFCVLQTILPKISGTGEALREALVHLQEWLLTDEASKEEVSDTDGNDPALICQSRPWARSAEKVKRMIDRLDTEGATTFWGT